MRTQYWYKARDLMRKYGFTRLKSKSMAWKLKHNAEDLSTFKNPDNISEMLDKNVRGTIIAMKNIGIVIRKEKP